MKKIPVTVLTGFLGSGKTTLLNRILSENHGLRIAVIENEFGEIGIDQALVIDADEEVFEMNNGCICCTVRGDLIRILGNLMKRKDKFDRILVETTGMADPGPVAQTFFVDEDVRDLFTLDGIVTLVDTKHLGLHLEDSKECREQLAFADVLVLNKTDLVDADELREVERRVRRINGLAKVFHATNADVPISEVLGIGGFDLERALETKPTFLEPEYPFEAVTTFDAKEGVVEMRLQPGPDPSIGLLVLPVTTESSLEDREIAERALRLWAKEPRELNDSSAGWDALSEEPVRVPTEVATGRTLRVPRDGRFALFSQHLPEEFSLTLWQDGREVASAERREFAAGHTHDEEVTSVGIHLEGALEPERLNTWLSRLLREKGLDIFRMKGILNVEGSPNRYVFQGVHMLLDGREDRPWGATPRANDLVFIGRNLDRKELTEGLAACLA